MIENHMINGDPDAGTYDPDEYRERALDDVIDLIMLFGVYPPPRVYGKPHRIEFDLAEWVAENVDVGELAQFLVAHIANDDDKNMRQDRLEKEIAAKLREHLRDSDMVVDKIEELHENERREHE